MKFLQVILIILSLLLVVESSSSSSSSDNNRNITRGASLFSNDTNPYWLSPSGNISFGFNQLSWSPDRYVVGIWFVKSEERTLVWTANPKDFPLHKPSSILFTNEGKLVLRIIPDNKEKLLLPDVPEPASYAKMHDNGNFVLYGLDSQIVWESFDYPTDTILSGQKLRPGVDLISGDHRLSVKNSNGFVATYNRFLDDQDGDGDGYNEEKMYVVSPALDQDSIILSLDVTGKLYLGSSDDEVVKVFYKRKKPVNKKEGDYIYRATLSSVGRLNLHKERIDGSYDNHPLQLYGHHLLKRILHRVMSKLYYLIPL